MSKLALLKRLNKSRDADRIFASVPLALTCFMCEARAANNNATMNHQRQDAAGASNPAGPSAALLADYDAANVRPWPHQLDAIRAVQQTKNKRCLVKPLRRQAVSLTIAGPRGGASDDGFRVVVICDRRQLDAQIYATVRACVSGRHSVGSRVRRGPRDGYRDGTLHDAAEGQSRVAPNATRQNCGHRRRVPPGPTTTNRCGGGSTRRSARRNWSSASRRRPKIGELATLGNPLHCFPALGRDPALRARRVGTSGLRLPVTVLDAVSKRPVDDARLRRLALETAQVAQAKAPLRCKRNQSRPADVAARPGHGHL